MLVAILTNLGMSIYVMAVIVIYCYIMNKIIEFLFNFANKDYKLFVTLSIISGIIFLTFVITILQFIVIGKNF